MAEYVPWILSAFTCVNLWLIGNKRKEGFAVGLLAQPIWLVFDWHVGAYGLMPLALVLGWLYVRGWLNWKRTEDAPYVVMRATAYDPATGNLTVSTPAEAIMGIPNPFAPVVELDKEQQA